MSRLGKRPIELPDEVDVKVEAGEIVVSGPEGEMKQELLRGISVDVESDTVKINRSDDTSDQKSKHGLIWSLVNNMITGVKEKFTKTLEINGLGYRARKKGDEIHLDLGYSNVQVMAIPDNLAVDLPNRTTIKISGVDKQQVGEFAARLRDLRDPDPYNQKGIKYEEEHIRQKVGKTVGGEGALGE